MLKKPSEVSASRVEVSKTAYPKLTNLYSSRQPPSCSSIVDVINMIDSAKFRKKEKLEAVAKLHPQLAQEATKLVYNGTMDTNSKSSIRLCVSLIDYHLSGKKNLSKIRRELITIRNLLTQNSIVTTLV